MKTCVVAGGGLVSLFAAFLLQETHDQVIVIEKTSKIGGFLSSFEDHGEFYDYGTHIPALTGDAVVDGILYGDKGKINESWHWFPYLKSENFFAGKWCETSPLPNLHHLPAATYQAAIKEILELPAPTRDVTTLEEYLIPAFGPTIAQNVYAPIFRKLLGAELNQIHPEALRIFGLQRVIGLTAEETKQLKADPRLDAKLGFHSYTDGAPSSGYVYPHGTRGIGTWIERLMERATREGKIKFRFGRTVKSLQHEGSKVTSVVLDDGEQIGCKNVLWALPLPLAFTGLGFAPQGKMPQFRTTSLFHFEFDRPLAKSFPQYLLCWDPNFLCYRLTLYPNVAPGRTRTTGSTLSVETLGDLTAGQALASNQERVFRELKELMVIHPDAKIVHSKTEYLGPTFPLMSQEFLQSCRNMVDQLEGRFSNFSAIGRHSAKCFFINDTLLDAKKTVGLRHT